MLPVSSAENSENEGFLDMVMPVNGYGWEVGRALDEAIEAATQKVGVKSERKFRSAIHYKCEI